MATSCVFVPVVPAKWLRVAVTSLSQLHFQGKTVSFGTWFRKGSKEARLAVQQDTISFSLTRFWE